MSDQMQIPGTNILLKLATLALLAFSAAGAVAQSSESSSPAPAAADAAAQQTQPAANPPAASPPTTPAQKPPDAPPPADDALTTIRATTNEVNVVFTVTDKRGRRVTDLKQADFRVVDDSKPAE